MDNLSKPVTVLKGVGKQRANDLKKLDIETIGDLLGHFPYRYEDRAHLKPISQLENGQVETVLGRVEQVSETFTRNGKRLTKVELACDTGYLALVWFNQRFIKDKLTYGVRVIATGRISDGAYRQMAVQDFEILGEGDDSSHFARITPIYRATEKSTVKFMRQILSEALEKYLPEVVDFLPLELRQKYQLMPLQEAMAEIHFPTAWERLNLARYRLVMDEFLVMILGLQMDAVLETPLQGVVHAKTEGVTNQFLQKLPFRLTDAQKRVIREIKKDMEQPEPMQRLVQGDVGCGKTIVAIYTLLKAVEGGYQGAMMAPTEILAQQHYLSLSRLLAPIGVMPVLLIGSMTTREKAQVQGELADGTARLVVGTHALIQKNVLFHNLGVVVIDEQHRFGVKQRLMLENKGQAPDVLVMTATPIPRSLALTLYGDMALSVIDELPPGRQPIRTYHVGEQKRRGMYGFIGKQLAEGYQAYVVCPLVAESEKMDLENATALADKLARDIYPQYRVGLLHGQMPTEQKGAVMEDFRRGELDILVATTVIEVGVDVPNANIIVIENAERFGLAQLHQLRGRVGRGQTQAHCILMAEPKTDEGKRRMAIMTKSNDGFVIAEEDLALRGPGEALGIRQHGLPDFKIANLVQDVKILEKSKCLAEEIVADGLTGEQYTDLRTKISKIYAQKCALQEPSS